MRNLIWFREDLRTCDNTALYHATQLANAGVIAVYFITHYFWKSHDMAASRIDFISRNLTELQATLSELNIPLIIHMVASHAELTQQLVNLINEYKIQALFYNKQYEIDELKRDRLVENALIKYGTKIFSYHDQLIFPPGKITTKEGRCYTVFTPFKNTWLDAYTKVGGISVLPAIKPQAKLSIPRVTVSDQFNQSDYSQQTMAWPAGEKAAQQRLQTFIATHLHHYHLQRDLPALSGTSQLSPYLSLGVLSPRQCLHAALATNKNIITQLQPGVSTWINELIWREFYKNIVYAFPRVCMHRPFKLATINIPWANNTQHFAAWQQGMTGFPIVDAGMRQLNATGWMHNRLRMVTAMFLSKLLLIDWRWGEKYFMEQLIDGDLAANNGGWQWCASTGTDAVPYFRIFNPTSQSQKFDPDGVFIKTYCPELQDFTPVEIHQPYHLNPLLAATSNYPAPIIDYATARTNVLSIFKNLGSN